MPADTFTVAEVSGRFGVGTATVLEWIRAGDLKAVNVSRSPRSKKPRWRVTAAALEAFEASRSLSPPVATRPRVKRDGYTPKFY